MAKKDRAAPFSKKHRRYWIPVTGGMLLIAAVNVTIGVCSYKEPAPTEPMEVIIPGHERKPGELKPNEIPADVIRAFAVKYPHTIPAGGIANGTDNTIIVQFPPGSALHTAVFKTDGTFVREE